MQDDPPLPFQLGQICADRYQIERVLGYGGMGVVYEAEHCFTRGRVALKVLYERVSDLPARMEQEARALATIQHRHVVRVLDGGATPNGIVWFAMERLEGRSLRSRLYEAGQLPIPIAIKYARQIAEGVAAAHAAGIVHRDLKPENAFVLEPEDEIRVLDFGTAKFRRGSLKTTDRMRVLGTYAYMAPERLQGMHGDPRSDVYSLGHVLYELLAGRHAFSEGPGPLDLPPAYELGVRQLTGQPSSPRRYRGELPEALAELTLQMLEKHPDDRPPSMAEIVARLEATPQRWAVSPPLAAPTGDPSASPSPLEPRAAGEAPRGPGLAPRGQAVTVTDSFAVPVKVVPAIPVVGARPIKTTPVRAPASPSPSSAANRRPSPAPHPDWLEQLRPSEYPRCRSFEAQAMLGALRFATRSQGERSVERDLAAVLAAASELGPEAVRALEDAAIAMHLLPPDHRAELRRRLHERAAAVDPDGARAAEAAIVALTARARASTPEAFADDAMRSTRALTGVVDLVPRGERDPRATETLLALANGGLEDLQLGHFGLLLLTRFGQVEQLRIRDAIRALAQGSEAERDGARAHLGHLVGESLRLPELATDRPRPRLSAPPVAGTGRASDGRASNGRASTGGGASAGGDTTPLPSRFWAAPVETRWVPLILAGALVLGVLLTLLALRPAMGGAPAGNLETNEEGAIAR